MNNKNLLSLFPTTQVSSALSGRIEIKNNTDPLSQPMYDRNLSRKVYKDALTFIERATPSGSGTATFSNIPTTYTHLMIRCHIFHSTTAATGYQMYFNGENTGTKYFGARVYVTSGAGATYQASGSGSTGINDIAVTYNTLSYPGSSIILIGDYASTTKTKSAMAMWNGEAWGTGEIGLSSGFWNDTAAITSVSIKTQSGGNFGANTLIDLYGVA